MDRSGEESVRGVIARINRAWRENDFSDLGDCFARDAVMVGPNYQVLGRGREFFVESYREFAQTAAVTQYSETEPLLAVFDHVAICAYGWTMTYDRDGSSSTERGTDQFVLCRVDAEWQVLWRYIRFDASDVGTPSQMTERLEHANLCVHDIDAVVRFLKTAFPNFQVRQDITESDRSRWVHVGTDQTYIALTQARPEESRRGAPYKGRPGLNHLAYEVDDVEALRARLRAAGYQDSTVPNAHPHRKRVYFYDPEGNDWEFVQYLSDDPRKRHDYELPDR